MTRKIELVFKQFAQKSSNNNATWGFSCQKKKNTILGFFHIKTIVDAFLNKHEHNRKLMSRLRCRWINFLPQMQSLVVACLGNVWHQILTLITNNTFPVIQRWLSRTGIHRSKSSPGCPTQHQRGPTGRFGWSLMILYCAWHFVCW